jgi:hypothetical protein
VEGDLAAMQGSEDEILTSRLAPIADEIAASGYAFVAGAQMDDLLSVEARAVWPAFAASWDDLGPDAYMADGGRYRRRRHATFRLLDGRAERNAHRPHYQSRDYNPLNGGIQRWFDPVKPEVAESAVALELLALCEAIFRRLEEGGGRPERHVEMHQFRIEPGPSSEAQPTPEGRHRDGVEWVCVLLVDRVNVEEGRTTIHDVDGRPLGAFTLRQPMDAVFLDDRRVAHGVTPVRRINPAQPGYRDVLVLTFDAP